MHDGDVACMGFGFQIALHSCAGRRARTPTRPRLAPWRSTSGEAARRSCMPPEAKAMAWATTSVTTVSPSTTWGAGGRGAASAADARACGVQWPSSRPPPPAAQAPRAPHKRH